METSPLLARGSPDTSKNGGVAGISKQSLWLAFSLFGGLIYGYNVSIASSLPYIADDLSLSTSQQEMASASATLSDACTMLVGGRLADYIGRRPTAMFACCASIVGALGMLALHSSFPVFIFWRLCTGMGNALSILVIPMYISENVDMTHRGRCISFFQLGVLLGCVLPYVPMLLWENWLLTLSFGALPAVVIFGCFCTDHFGESATWTTRQSRDAETTLKPSTVPSSSYELFLGILLAYSNNSIDPTLFYGPEIISQTLGSAFTRHSSNVVGMLLCGLSVVSVVYAAVWLPESFHRRRFYLICHGVVVICFAICSGIFLALPTSLDESAFARTILLAAMGIMVLFQTVGPGMLFVLIVSELFEDGAVRATYMSYCTFAMSAFSLVINGTMLSLFAWLSVGGTFCLYGVSYAACFVIFWYGLPETSTRQIVA
ncbi:unnamed protein product [Aphanomyces euteiches]|uniref:Major facilitator superfamily (MFS) profile domain-containing protein n=1 Tax=Aphanomyces euteiches TaxID=100861 RepID=A0A6G0WDN0_9STRA|nr:hypothetical protein Ae201684_016172 [Aphanomyces euteiches]KAH9052129.1 hypothetical protein Ae201684P_013631 [Aphanomyces euteiches]KAH9155424.1 hypothetical protein AeRB84_002592 [Aphanomyces euteiches]